MITGASTGYALLAMGYIAKKQGKKLIVSQAIAKEYNLPLEYLLKILKDLAKANVLRSKRGPRGGFSLARSPNKISMLEIIEAIEGPLASQLNLVAQAPKEKFSGKTEQAYVKGLDAARAVLKKTKLADLI